MNIEAMIERCINLKQGNKEFILYCFGNKDWCAGIGNPSYAVSMLEVWPEIDYRAENMFLAVEGLLKQLEVAHAQSKA